MGRAPTAEPPPLFPEELLSWTVSQCTSCGRLTLQGPLLGQILQGTTREHLSDAQLLAALRVHCAHTPVHDCAVCWHERTARAHHAAKRSEFLALLNEQAAKDAARFYATSTYQEQERRERHRLDRLVQDRAQKAQPVSSEGAS
jgi:hypothetical protein